MIVSFACRHTVVVAVYSSYYIIFAVHLVQLLAVLWFRARAGLGLGYGWARVVFQGKVKD